MPVCIFSTVNQVEAGILQSALEGENIANYAKNLHSNSIGLAGWSTPFAGTNLVTGNIEILVKEEDVEKALEIVKTLFGDADEDIDNPEIEEISQHPNTSEKEEIKKTESNSDSYDVITDEEKIPDINDIDGNNKKRKKLSPAKKFFMFFGIVLIIMLLFTVLTNVLSSQSSRSSSSGWEAPRITEKEQKYYYEMFLVDREYYFTVPQPSAWDKNTIKDFRNKLKQSQNYRFLFSTADTSENDLFTLFTNAGYAPDETTDIISYINNVGNTFLASEYQEDANYFHVAYFEKF